MTDRGYSCSIKNLRKELVTAFKNAYGRHTKGLKNKSPETLQRADELEENNNQSDAENHQEDDPKEALISSDSSADESPYIVL